MVSILQGQKKSSRLLTTNTAMPCDENGGYLPDPPPAPPVPPPIDGLDPVSWDSFGSRLDFDFVHYHFVEVQSSAGAINTALDMWQASVLKHGENVPWTNAQDLYDTIDSIQQGDAPWKVYKISYQGPRPLGTPPKWMTETYELCTHDSRLVLHNQLASSEFKGKTNFVPYQQFNGEGKRVWSNPMSANWAWKQAVSLMEYFKKHAIIDNCCNCRTLSQRIQQHTEQCLYPLLLEATRLLSQLHQVNKNITLSICPQEI